MLPGIHPGDRLWTESVSFRFRRPRRGEVVLVRPPGSAYRVVKRVAAVPGDEVAGRRLREDEYFVVGDQAAASTDSRDYGPVPARAIEARVMS